MCTEPGGQTVACLWLIRDATFVQDHCMGRRWSACESYGVPHVFRARWTDGGLPPAHSERAVCPRPLLGQKVVDCDSNEVPHEGSLFSNDSINSLLLNIIKYRAR